MLQQIAEGKLKDSFDVSNSMFWYRCCSLNSVKRIRAASSYLCIMKMNSPVARLRFIGILEGISYLVLLGIAMPLKYYADMPVAVKYVGWAHGLLFVLFMIALAQVWMVKKWSFLKVLLAFIASLLPFGTFVLDRKLRNEE
jgi:integral membrane protein